MKLELIAAKVVLDVFNPNEVIQAANDTLEDNYSDSLVELATSTDLRVSEVKQLLHCCFEELGMTWPTQKEAIETLLIYWLSQIAERSVEPREAMRAVMNQVLQPSGVLELCERHVGDNLGLEQLLGAFTSYDDVEENPKTVSYSEKYGDDAVRMIDQDIIKLSANWIKSKG